jgi:hypothetical protein
VKDLRFKPSGCALCGHAIDPNWSSGSRLGSTCRDCYGQPLFSPENFEFHTTVGDNGKNDYAGTRVMIEGRIGTFETPCGDWSFVNFDGQPRVVNIGFWELDRLYRVQLPQASA